MASEHAPGWRQIPFAKSRVDFNTLKRTPKLTAQWFREVARTNAVV
jgi:hypothetical protein